LEGQKRLGEGIFFVEKVPARVSHTQNVFDEIKTSTIEFRAENLIPQGISGKKFSSWHNVNGNVS